MEQINVLIADDNREFTFQCAKYLELIEEINCSGYC